MDIKNNRAQFLFGTWKNKLSLVDSINLTSQIKKEIKNNSRKIVGICPSSISLQLIASLLKDIPVAAQNCGWNSTYSLTGEISSSDLKTLNVKYCIIGHSERRIYLHETEEIIKNRLVELFQNDIVPILCIGEQLEDYENNRLIDVLKIQLNTLRLALLESNIAVLPSTFIIAYEPMWAISTSGSGKTLDAESADNIHLVIRKELKSILNFEIENEISILYGGSLSSKNSSDFFSKKNIDGGLVGSSTQSYQLFSDLIKSFYNS
jgi:triosephosphate isomerase